jgi:hypothetical protein
VAPVALTMLAIGGCGGSGDPPGHARAALRVANEHHLLALLGRARSEDAVHSKVGVDAALARFIDDVNSLRGSRELTPATAAELDRQALATEAQASRQLPPSNKPVDEVQTTATVSTPPQPPNPKPHPRKGAPGPPGQEKGKGKPPKGGHGPGGQQGGDGNAVGSGDGDS